MNISKILKLGSELTIGECLFLFFVLWGSGTLLSTDSSLPLFGLTASFLLVITENNKVINRANFQKLIIATGAACLFSFFQYSVYTGVEGSAIVFKLFFLFLITVLFSQSEPNRNQERVKHIVKLIVFFSIISNVLYIIYMFGDGLDLQISEKTESMHFYYLEMVCFNTISGFAYRNGGIFWEPGMYQVYLSFALLYYLYAVNVKRKYLLITYLTLSIISTFSVTGYIVTIAIFALYSLRNNNGVVGKFIVIAAFIIGMLYIMPYLTESLVRKQTTGSYDARSNDLFFGLSIFLEHPIIGTGLGQNVYVQAYTQKFGETRQDSNGMMNVLISFGIIGFYIVSRYIYFFAHFLKKYLSSSIVLTFLLWIVVSSNSEPIVFHPFMFMLIGMGLSYSLNKNDL